MKPKIKPESLADAQKRLSETFNDPNMTLTTYAPFSFCTKCNELLGDCTCGKKVVRLETLSLLIEACKRNGIVIAKVTDDSHLVTDRKGLVSVEYSIRVTTCSVKFRCIKLLEKKGKVQWYPDIKKYRSEIEDHLMLESICVSDGEWTPSLVGHIFKAIDRK